MHTEMKSEGPVFDDGGEQRAVRAERRCMRKPGEPLERKAQRFNVGQWAARHCGNRDSGRKCVDNKGW